MWNRVELKEQARSVIRVSYWKAVFVSILLLIVSGGEGASFDFKSNELDYLANSADEWLSPAHIALLLGTLFTISVVAIFISVLVFNPLEVRLRHYFLESTQMRFNLQDITRGFFGKHYLNIVITMFIRSLYNALWYILLVIPGIIKSYSYSMVPYLLSENPSIPPNRAIEMSRQITSGHKWNMFVLDLSFIGWFLLGSLAFGIGSIFVLPYFNTTNAQLYVALRSIALDSQIISLQELESY